MTSGSLSVWLRWVFNAPRYSWMMYLLHCSEKLGDYPCFSALWFSILHKSVFDCCPSKYDDGHVLMCCPLLWNMIWWCVIHSFENKKENAFKLSDPCFNFLMIYKMPLFDSNHLFPLVLVWLAVVMSGVLVVYICPSKFSHFNFKTAWFMLKSSPSAVS